MTSPPVTDEQLIARVVVQDDRHAFSELVRRYQSGVRATLRRLTAGNHALADDLAQETFLAAYRNLRSFRQEARFSTWLYRIATNAFLAEARKRHEELLGDRDGAIEDEEATTTARRRPPPATTPAARRCGSTWSARSRCCPSPSGQRSSSATITTCRTRKRRTCWAVRSAPSRRTSCAASRSSRPGSPPGPPGSEP
ncbi:MAG: sigma-70 family RNA polymerase sigma factor [Betaproteobacteria bacterium]|nr:sigma-70 family RNA polymerase sigma factor [Betaproteobacteria bacterium]